MEITFRHNRFMLSDRYWKEYQNIIDETNLEAANLHLFMCIMANKNGEIDEKDLFWAAKNMGLPFPINTDARPFFQGMYDSGVRCIDHKEIIGPIQ